MADYHIGSHTHALCFLLSGVARSGKTPVASYGTRRIVAIYCLEFPLQVTHRHNDKALHGYIYYDVD